MPLCVPFFFLLFLCRCVCSLNFQLPPACVRVGGRERIGQMRWLQSTAWGVGERGKRGGCWGSRRGWGVGRGCMLIAKLTRGAYSASSSLAKLSAWSTCTPTALRHHAGAANVSSPQCHSAASRSRSHFEATETPERARHRLACVRPPPQKKLASPACADAIRLCAQN